MSYPEYIRENLGGLADYLLQPPEPSELDDNGCFSKEACKHVDQLVLADLSRRIKGFYMPAEPVRGTNPNNKWRTVSCLQKAIRFEDAEMAKFAASAAYDMDKSYLLRRLGICAIEDVGAGNLYGLLAVLAASGSQQWRQTVDERRLACFLAELLAIGPKDRSACDLLIIVDFNASLDKKGMGKWTNEQLAAVVINPAMPMEVRMTAAWLMAGTKKFWGETMPKENDRPATPLFRLMVERGMCRAMLYAAAKVASRLNEGMFVSLLFMDEWLRRTQQITISETAMPEMPKVGKLLGAAYDMHTREGRTAIGKFRKENMKGLAPFLEHAKPGMEDLMLWFGIFVAEGGLLSRKVVYHNAERLRALSKKTELSYPGLPEALHEEYFAFLQSHLNELNECRRKVLWAVTNRP